ncbi:hypothetical protein AVEN_239521-1 [Araneus ventricosus]|uniref:Ig-like domain-containing protein n=1 Tax=Araneus ventricosus TaxID=182803 RepID=A0A4Y2B9C3_ARAVE|nr:hypothetical protein AVEN_239521-1 [Araneus ventricosus]
MDRVDRPFFLDGCRLYRGRTRDFPWMRKPITYKFSAFRFVLSFDRLDIHRFSPLRAVLPDENPKILGSQPRYEVGDIVNVTCKSGPSKPAAQLKWSINGKDADPLMERKYATEDHLDGLSTSTLGLIFVVRPSDLHQGGAVTLRCTATVSQTYSTTSEELIVGDRDPELSSPPNPFSRCCINITKSQND